MIDESLWNKLLYASINNKNLFLQRCSFKDENEFKRALNEVINNMKNNLDITLIECGEEVVLPDGLKVDLLLIDGDGSPVIIETKLGVNREIRRAVLGQLLEYMTRIHLNPEAIVDVCNNVDDQDFRTLAKKKAKRKEIIGIIASDKIPEIVEYTIEVLNSDLNTMSLYGLELQKYCSEDGSTYIVIPRFIGRTVESAITGKERKTRNWKYEDLVEYFKENLDDEILQKRLLDILEWAMYNGIFVMSRAKDPAFGLMVRSTGKRVITIYSDGRMDVCYGINCSDNYKTPEDRKHLRDELIKLGLFDMNVPEPNSQSHAKRTRSIATISEEKYEKLKKILETILL